MRIEIEMAKPAADCGVTLPPAWMIRKDHPVFPEIKSGVTLVTENDGEVKWASTWVRIERDNKFYFVECLERSFGSKEYLPNIISENIQRLILSAYNVILFYALCGWEVEDDDIRTETERLRGG